MMEMRKSGLGLDELLTVEEDLLVLRGAEDDDDKDDPDAESKKKGEDEDPSDDPDDEDDETKEDPDKKAEPSDEEDPRIASLTEEKQRHYDRRKAAEARVTELQAELAALQAAGATDDTVKERLTKLEEDNTQLVATNRKLALDNSFLSNNKHEWLDADAALRLLDRDMIEIEDDGKVHGLTVALDKLAKDKPYLLKPKEATKQQPARKTGDPAKKAPGGDAAAKKARELALKKKYPGLRR